MTRLLIPGATAVAAGVLLLAGFLILLRRSVAHLEAAACAAQLEDVDERYAVLCGYPSQPAHVDEEGSAS